MKFVENEAPSQGPRPHFRLVQANLSREWLAPELLTAKCFTPEQLPKIVTPADWKHGCVVAEASLASEDEEGAERCLRKEIENLRAVSLGFACPWASSELPYFDAKRQPI